MTHLYLLAPFAPLACALYLAHHDDRARQRRLDNQIAARFTEPRYGSSASLAGRFGAESVDHGRRGGFVPDNEQAELHGRSAPRSQSRGADQLVRSRSVRSSDPITTSAL